MGSVGVSEALLGRPLVGQEADEIHVLKCVWGQCDSGGGGGACFWGQSMWLLRASGFLSLSGRREGVRWGNAPITPLGGGGFEAHSGPCGP